MLLALWAVPVLVALFAARRALQARRTRRQTVRALGSIPELAGEVPWGTAERAAAWGAALAIRVGSDPSAVATAARLHGIDGTILTESDISPDIAQLVQEATNAPRGQARGSAALVRVARGYAERLGNEGTQPSGALFTTLVAHPAGDERQAARELATIVQAGFPSA